MVSFRSADSQAQYAARSLQLESRGTERNYEQALKGVAVFLKENKLEDLRNLTQENVMRYLVQRSQEVGQKTLDLDRQAIQALLKEKLPTVKSEQDQTLKSRAYTEQQIQMVATAQSEKHSLATQIAMNAGLRAHELLTWRAVI